MRRAMAAVIAAVLLLSAACGSSNEPGLSDAQIMSIKAHPTPITQAVLEYSEPVQSYPGKEVAGIVAQGNVLFIPGCTRNKQECLDTAPTADKPYIYHGLAKDSPQDGTDFVFTGAVIVVWNTDVSPRKRFECYLMSMQLSSDALKQLPRKAQAEAANQKESSFMVWTADIQWSCNYQAIEGTARV